MPVYTHIMPVSLRPFLALLMSLTLAVASVGFAQARHHAAGAQTMVICSGYGMVTITLDATGKKVERSVPCPDCVGAALALLGIGAVLPALPPRVALRLGVTGTNQSDLTLVDRWSHPRAPPTILV